MLPEWADENREISRIRLHNGEGSNFCLVPLGLDLWCHACEYYTGMYNYFTCQ